MPLRRSPLLTPATLAVCRANALKSTGPRLAAGKLALSSELVLVRVNSGENGTKKKILKFARIEAN